MQTLHRPKAAGEAGRSQHQYAVSVSLRSQVSETSYGPWSPHREILCGRSHTHIQWILHANHKLGSKNSFRRRQKKFFCEEIVRKKFKNTKKLTGLPHDHTGNSDRIKLILHDRRAGVQNIEKKLC